MYQYCPSRIHLSTRGPSICLALPRLILCSEFENGRTVSVSRSIKNIIDSCACMPKTLRVKSTNSSYKTYHAVQARQTCLSRTLRCFDFDLLTQEHYNHSVKRSRWMTDLYHSQHHIFLWQDYRGIHITLSIMIGLCCTKL